MAKKAGMEEVFQSRNEPARQATLTMTDAEKATFIRENGLESFKELVA